MSRITRKQGLLFALVAVLAFSAFAGNAAAVEAKPGWESNTRVYPTHLKPGGKGIVEVQVFNTGAGSTTSPVTVTDTLPAGLEATEAGALENFGEVNRELVEGYEENEVGASLEQLRVWDCSGTTVVTCHTGPGAGGVERPIDSGFAGRIGIKVNVVGSPGAGTNRVTVSGGGAPSASERTSDLTISPASPGFGLAGQFDGWFGNIDGTPDTQAGSHPYEMTLNFALNNAGGTYPAGGPLRDLSIKLPPGLIGDPHAVPQCSRQQFILSLTSKCPPDTQVGTDRPSLNPRGEAGYGDWAAHLPVYNLVPPPGEPAEFGFQFAGSLILIDTSVRSGSDYGITGTARNLAQQIVYNSITFWGVPDEASHDHERCVGTKCGYSAGNAEPRPLLTVPTSCEVPQTFGVTVDSWNSSLPAAKETFEMHDQNGVPTGFTGCEHLGFNTQLDIAPDTSFADTPAGLTVDIKVPQEGLSQDGSLATSNIKDTTVTLPEGVAINPGQAAGLGACGPGEDGLTTEAEKAEGKEDNGPSHCPNASHVGTDEIETPLLSKPLKGNVYIMPSDPPHVQLLVTAEGEGVFVKLVGDVHLNEQTGQLVTTFSNTPELPFTDFKLSFSGGSQAALSTPTRCGTYTTTSDFTPWSAPLVEDLFPHSSFQITAGTNGGACPSSPLPFSPSMIAGSTTDQAGGFTDFSLLLTRPDDQQRVSNLRFKTPEGLLGMISSVSALSRSTG